jgi:hypothetical protein
MNNKPITINANATINGVEVLKMTVETPHGFAGLDGKFDEQSIRPSGGAKEDSEMATYKVLEGEGYCKSHAVFGISRWARYQSPSIFTDHAGAWLGGEPPTPHPISVDWARKSAAAKPQPIHSSKAVTEDSLTNLGYKLSDVGKNTANGEMTIWLKDGCRPVFVDDNRAFLSKYQGCWHPVSVDWLLLSSV